MCICYRGGWVDWPWTINTEKSLVIFREIVLLYIYLDIEEKKKFLWFSGRCQIVQLNALYTARACCSSDLIKRQGQENTFSLHISQSVKVFIFKLPHSSCLLKALLPMYLCACWPLNSPHCFKYDWSSCVPLVQQSPQKPDHQAASSFTVWDTTGQENHLAKGDQRWVPLRGLWLDVNWSGDSS